MERGRSRPWAARTHVVEAPWGQPLREVGGKQEAGEEGKEDVVTVAGQGVSGAAASPAAHEDLHTHTEQKQTQNSQIIVSAIIRRRNKAAEQAQIGGLWCLNHIREQR